jgi:nucleoside-diphosphate-sugar epimerase
MKILITGIAGFVGSTLARKLINENPHFEIIGIDNLKYGYKERIEDIENKIKFYHIDIKDLASSLKETSVDIIIHCAAIAPLPENQVDLYESINQNVAMCASVSEYATNIGCENIIFFSSGAIYEGSGNKACFENDTINTSLIYPTSKYLAEQLFQSLAKTYSLKVVAIRLFNLYGPNQDYFRKQPPLLGYLLKSIHKGEVPKIFASRNAKRDYIHIDDLYYLVKKICEKFEDIKSGEFIAVNAGSGKVYSVYDIIENLGRVIGENIDYVVGDKKDFWIKYPQIFDKKLPLKQQFLIDEVDKIAIADIQFAKNFFEWNPSIEMEDGLKECYEYSREVLK